MIRKHKMVATRALPVLLGWMILLQRIEVMYTQLGHNWKSVTMDGAVELETFPMPTSLQGHLQCASVCTRKPDLCGGFYLENGQCKLYTQDYCLNGTTKAFTRKGSTRCKKSCQCKAPHNICAFDECIYVDWIPVSYGFTYLDIVPEVPAVTNIPDMPQIHRDAPALFFDDSLIVCGGWNASMVIDSTCSKLGKSGDWVTFPSLKTPRRTFPMLPVGNKLFASGGLSTGDLVQSSTEVYDNGEWNYGPSLGRNVRTHCAVTYSDSEVILIGGSMGYGTLLDIVEKFNIESGVKTALTKLKIPEVQMACTLFNDRLFIAGGTTSGGAAVSKAEYLDLSAGASGQWKPMPYLPEGIKRGSMLFFNGHITLFENDAANTKIFIYIPGSGGNFDTGSWKQEPMTTGRKFGRTVLVPVNFRLGA